MRARPHGPPGGAGDGSQRADRDECQGRPDEADYQFATPWRTPRRQLLTKADVDTYEFL